MFTDQQGGEECRLRDASRLSASASTEDSEISGLRVLRRNRVNLGGDRVCEP